MSGGGKEKRRRPDYRAPERQPAAQNEPDRAAPAPRRPGGILGFLGGVDPSLSPYPTLRATYGRAFVAVCSSPPILGSVVAIILAARLVFVGLGVPPRGTSIVAFLALPPVSLFLDVQISGEIFGTQVGLLVVPAFLLVRALIVTLLCGMAIESIRRGKVTTEGLRAGLRGFPVFLGICVVELGAVFLGSVIVGFVPGLSVFGLFAVLTVVLFFFGYAPPVAVRSPGGLQWSLRKTIAAARVPGSQNVMVAVVNVFLTLLVLSLLVPGASDVDAAPGFVTWAGILLANVLHVVYLAVYAYRYLFAEELLPEPVVTQRARRR